MTTDIAREMGFENGKLVRTLEREDGESFSPPISSREWLAGAPDEIVGDKGLEKEFIRGCSRGYASVR